METNLWGSLVGAGIGFGCLLLWWSYYARRVTLSRRLGAWLTVQERTSAGELGFFAALTEPVWLVLEKFLNSVGSTSKSVASRMQYAAILGGVHRMRMIQAVGGVGCASLGLLLVVILLLTRGIAWPLGLAVIVVGGLVGVLVPDQWLTYRAKNRQAGIDVAIPDCAELLSLSVSAGEGISEALARVAAITSQPLRSELELTVAEIRTGIPVTQAILNLRMRNNAGGLVRFCDSLIVALERGTPLVDILRVQTHEIREAVRRQLIEEGGRKEIAMLVPVVFLILPITVLFAFYPGLEALRINF